MYATAHRVQGPHGQEGINSFLHLHGVAFPWPEEPWRLPETEPGTDYAEHIMVQPGGNDVRSYLDILAPDTCLLEEIESALTGLWLELVADTAVSSPLGELPNPLVYRRGRVVIRLGVEGYLLASRAMEVTALRQDVDRLLKSWRSTP